MNFSIPGSRAWGQRARMVRVTALDIQVGLRNMVVGRHDVRENALYFLQLKQSCSFFCCHAKILYFYQFFFYFKEYFKFIFFQQKGKTNCKHKKSGVFAYSASLVLSSPPLWTSNQAISWRRMAWKNLIRTLFICLSAARFQHATWMTEGMDGRWKDGREWRKERIEDGGKKKRRWREEEKEDG